MKEQRFLSLLQTAIGPTRTQATFAEQAKITPEHLNRMLRHPEKYKPSLTTLKRIADASEGRVEFAQLIDACEYPLSAVQTSDAIGYQSPAERIIYSFKEGMLDLSGKATRHQNLDDIIWIIKSLYGIDEHLQWIVEDQNDFSGNGHAGAEQTANITIKFTMDNMEYALGFVVFYCRTKRNGVIFSDVAFDLLTLNEFNHRIGGEKLMEIATQPGADRSKYHTVFVKRQTA
jgi:hypothetical protein